MPKGIFCPLLNTPSTHCGSILGDDEMDPDNVSEGVRWPGPVAFQRISRIALIGARSFLVGLCGMLAGTVLGISPLHILTAK